MLNTNDNQIITQDNVKQLGEMIAIHALKTAVGYSGVAAYDLYKGLVKDLENSNDVNYVFSDGYDIAQTAICFLCGYIGKMLGDDAETGTEKDGRAITVKRACYSEVNRCIRKERSKAYRTINIDSLVGRDLAIPFECEIDTQDYSVVEEIIKQMKLTNGQYEALFYRINGMALREIAKLLSITGGAVWARLMTVRRKYLRQFSNQSYSLRR